MRAQRVLAVLTAVVLAGCAAPDRLGVGASARFTVRQLADDTRYGTLGVTPLRVERGDPAELTRILPGAGTPYYVTIGFASGRPSTVTGIDDTGAEHEPLDAGTASRLRPCAVHRGLRAVPRLRHAAGHRAGRPHAPGRGVAGRIIRLATWRPPRSRSGPAAARSCTT